MPVDLQGTTYYTASEVAQLVGRNRSTLWRWRCDGKVPPGRLYCDQQVLYNEEEVALIYSHAHRMHPADVAPRLRHQLSLFSAPPR